MSDLRDKKFDLQTARLIKKAYDDDEFIPFIFYGPLGWGKSAYAIKCAALIYGDFKEYNYDMVKDFLVFHPREFLKKCQEMPLDARYPVLIWDDAGLWLHALDHSDPFVKSVAKYLNVARTDFGSIIFTTPWPTWIVKKVRGLPQAVMIKITKAGGGGQNPGNPFPYRRKYRFATAYYSWVAPDMKKTGVRKIHQDKFSAYLPDDFYEWYKPRRDKYAMVAKRMMAKALEKLDLGDASDRERQAIGEEMKVLEVPAP